MRLLHRILITLATALLPAFIVQAGIPDLRFRRLDTRDGLSNSQVLCILRDSKYRNCPAKDTIQRWPSVLAGEDKWIFPFQENADAMFNSALMFELAIIKDKILPILDKVTERDPEYSEVVRLKKFLLYFNSVSDKEIPPTSLLREFMGGSSFEY